MKTAYLYFKTFGKKTWLESKDATEILALLKPCDLEEMYAYSLWKLVNSPRN